jgi:hypothetical protein
MVVYAHVGILDGYGVSLFIMSAVTFSRSRMVTTSRDTATAFAQKSNLPIRNTI